MRAEFFRGDSPDHVVGTATWEDGRAVVDSDDDQVRRTLERVFRSTAVLVDDPAMRPGGTSGPTVIEAGGREWFTAAAQTRGSEAGLSVRLVVDRPGGWDPALDPQTYGWAGPKGPVPQV
jgi:hypothetical protein